MWNKAPNQHFLIIWNHPFLKPLSYTASTAHKTGESSHPSNSIHLLFALPAPGATACLCYRVWATRWRPWSGITSGPSRACVGAVGDATGLMKRLPLSGAKAVLQSSKAGFLVHLSHATRCAVLEGGTMRSMTNQDLGERGDFYLLLVMLDSALSQYPRGLLHSLAKNIGTYWIRRAFRPRSQT